MDDFKKLCTTLPTQVSRELINTRPVWIFGAGQFGRDLCSVLRKRGFDIAGFIETKPKLKEISGLPVLAWTELNTAQRQMQLAVGIFNRAVPMDELESLARDAGFTDVLMPWHLYAQFGDDLGLRYWLSAPQVLLAALPRIETVYQNLSDETSRRCLLDILSFRLGKKTSYASFKHDENQYFNELTLSALQGKQIAYVDGGAYNGDTYLELASIADISSAFLFEPDPENYKQLNNNLRKIYNKMYCLPMALTDRYSILSFNSDGGEGGTISEHGNQHIATGALDELIHHHDINFIKLDVEGAEIPALRGGADLIGRCRPVLALSLYHRPEDIWEIPELVNQLCKNYRFYIRQHYFNSFDSVFYAVPI
jgi:FkbM family methyltransferase